jgi:hypothetical protein
LGLIAALQYFPPVAQDHQALWIVFDGGFVERTRRSKAMVLHEYAFDAGVLATIAK